MSAPGLFFSAFFSEKSNRDIDDLIRAYAKLPGSVARKHLKAAIRRSIKPFTPALKAATPRGATGNLRRSVITVVKFGTKVSRGANEAFRGTAIGIVGFSRKGKKKNQKGDHSVLVEQGSKPRRRKGIRGNSFSAGQGSTGTMPPKHMLRDTLAAKRSGILSNMEIEMGVSLERATQEAARRAAL
jgi:plasmid stabilization system protein ParE